MAAVVHTGLPRNPARGLLRRILWRRGTSCLVCSPEFFLLGPGFATGNISREGGDGHSNVIAMGELPFA